MEEIQGSDGQITLLEDRVIISRKGFFSMIAHQFAGPIEVPISSISRIEMKEASVFSAGSIKLIFHGNDFQIIKFQNKSNAKFKEVKEAIFSKLSSN